MTHWWQWPDSIFSFPGSFCQDFLPTQLHALTYVLLAPELHHTLPKLGRILSNAWADYNYKFLGLISCLRSLTLEAKIVQTAIPFN